MPRKSCAANPDFVLTGRSNQELLEGAKHLSGRHRKVTAHLIAHLAEIYARKLHVAERYSYLGDYCVAELGLSEDEGHRRAHAAVLAHAYPVILDMLLEGSIHLTSLRIIGKCLTRENHREVLDTARGKTKTELEHLAAALDPKPDVPTVLRKLPEPQSGRGETWPGSALLASGAGVDGTPADLGIAETTATSSESLAASASVDTQFAGANEHTPFVPPVPKAKASMKPLAPARYDLHLTIDQETHDALRELQELLRHQMPNGDLVRIVKDAIIEHRDRVQGKKFAHTKRSRKARRQESWIENESDAGEVSADGVLETAVTKVGKAETEFPAIPRGRSRVNSRHIPATVKREVCKRDKGRCAFVGRSGKRCLATGKLEFHHLQAYALGGPATVDNIALRCRTHNAYEGVALFGDKKSGRPEANRTEDGAHRPGAMDESAREALAP